MRYKFFLLLVIPLPLLGMEDTDSQKLLQSSLNNPTSLDSKEHNSVTDDQVKKTTTSRETSLSEISSEHTSGDDDDLKGGLEILKKNNRKLQLRSGKNDPLTEEWEKD